MPLPNRSDVPELPSGVRIVVVGGANTDVVGVSTAALLQRDSNPGTIRTSPGGVGRNIAENLARLGVDVELISAFGDDEAGRALMASCRARGIGLTASIVAADLPGAHYLAILDERHDMAVAVNDMRVLDRLTPDALADADRTELLVAADLVVVDANLSAEALDWIAGVVRAPIVFEPVSAAKVSRAAGMVRGLAALTPNALEAATLLGHEVVGIAGALEAARELVGLGAQAAFVTCGVDGTTWAGGGRSGVVAAPRVEVVNASGAGDAFCAGVAYALAAGADAHDAALLGTAMASFALADDDTVSRAITRAAVFETMEGSTS